jgi:hypothetical protein
MATEDDFNRIGNYVRHIGTYLLRYTDWLTFEGSHVRRNIPGVKIEDQC